MEKKLDFSAAWEDVVAMLKANLGLVLPIVGVFIILPAIVMSIMVPEPVFVPGGDQQAIYAQLIDYLSRLGPWLIISSILAMLGSLAIYHLILGGKNPTVGEAISLALGSFLTALLAGLISGVAVTLGMIALIIPGIYLAIKFSLAAPAIVAENIKNPIEALSRSWALTKGNSLRIFGFILIIAIVGFVAAGILSTIIGGILGYILPVLASIVSSVLNGIVSVLLMFVYIAVYRQLK
jgi:hypothetical protein